MENQTIENIKISEEVKPVVPEKKTEFPAIEMAFKKIEELELLNKRLSEQIDKADKLISESILKGRAFAGSNDRVLTEEEKIREESKKLMESSGLNPFK